MTADHIIRVTGYDYGTAQLELECLAGPGDPCRLVLTEGVSNPVDECNAKDWWDASDPDDLMPKPMVGPPPWLVEVIWMGEEESPEIVQPESVRELGDYVERIMRMEENLRRGPRRLYDLVLEALDAGVSRSSVAAALGFDEAALDGWLTLTRDQTVNDPS